MNNEALQRCTLSHFKADNTKNMCSICACVFTVVHGFLGSCSRLHNAQFELIMRIWVMRFQSTCVCLSVCVYMCVKIMHRMGEFNATSREHYSNGVLAPLASFNNTGPVT